MTTTTTASRRVNYRLFGFEFSTTVRGDYDVAVKRQRATERDRVEYYLGKTNGGGGGGARARPV